MPYSAVTSDDEEGLGGDASMSNERMADFHAASLRASMTRHPGLLPGQTSVRQKLTEFDVDSLRTATQVSITNLQESLQASIIDGTFQPGTPKKGDMLDLKEYLGGRLFVGMPPETYGAMRKAKVNPAPDDDIFSLGHIPNAKVVSGGAQGDQKVQSLGYVAEQAVKSLGYKADQITVNQTFKEDEPAFPTFPRRPGTLVDSLSLISLLNQPRPLSMADADSVISRIARKDPFAASLLGKAPPALLLPATADEVKRVINHEVLVDLNFQGYDFARPADIFEKIGTSRAKAPQLDPARRKIVDFLVTWGSYVAATSKLAPQGTMDVESPLGFTWLNRSLRDPTTGMSEQVGKIRAGIGESMTPYVIDFRDPVTGYLFPGARGPKAVDHPVQTFLSESLGFIMDYLSPGTNIKDALGRHFIPGGAGSGSVYKTVGNWREEFGAPKSETLLGLDGQVRMVSVDPSPRNSLGRGWFGWNPGGDALDRWNEIRGAQASKVVMDPELGPRSTLKNLSFWGGTYKDPYRADSTFALRPEFKFRKQGVDPKTGLMKFDAVFAPTVQLDHVQPLNWLMQHGGKEMAEIAAQMWVGGADVKKGWAYDMPRLKADITNGEVVKSHVGDRLVANDTLGTNDTALKLMQAFAFLGYAGDKRQFVLTSAELNQDKSDKGPQGWVPYPHARNAVQHQANLSYVQRWRELSPIHRKQFEDALGRSLPDLFEPRRDDQLAMREIEIGVDQLGRLTRPFGQLYTQYIDSPSLSETPLYRRMQAMKYLSVWGMGSTLGLWPLKPASRAYLMIRQHLGDGLWRSMAPTGSVFDFKAVSVGARFNRVGNFYRERWAGIPFIGARKPTGPAGSTDALHAFEDLLRSGRKAAAVDRFGEIIENSTKAHPISLATPKQLLDYYRGAEEPFGSMVSRVHSGDELGHVLYSERGIQKLNASPLALEVFEKLKGGKFGSAANTFFKDMFIKSADYGLRGAMGVGAGLGNLMPARLIPILGVEAFANLAGSMTGATVSNPLQFTPYSYKGGPFKWMLNERAARVEQFARAQQEYDAAMTVQDWSAPLGVGRLDDAQKQLGYARRAHSEFETLLRNEGSDLLRIAEMPGLRGKILRAATEHPRTMAAATKLVVRGATHVKEVLQAPFIFQARLAEKIASSRALSAGSHAFGGAMTVLGGVESYSRYSHAKQLASTPVDSLPLELRAELDAYMDGGSPLKRSMDAFLDAGAPIGPPVTPLQWALAIPGVALATGNIFARADVRGRLRGTAFQDSIQVRLLRNTPTFSEQSRFKREASIMANKGLIQDSIRVTSLNAMSRDTTEMFRMMRDDAAKKGMDKGRLEERIGEVRQGFLMVPAVDAMGYAFTIDKFGREHRKPFKQAGQFRSDGSLVATKGPTYDSLVRVKPAARVGDPTRMDYLTGNDRTRRLHEEAEGYRVQHYAKQISQATGWERFLRALAFTNGMTEVPVNGSDSADVERDLRQRQQLRKQRVDSTRPR